MTAKRTRKAGGLEPNPNGVYPEAQGKRYELSTRDRVDLWLTTNTTFAVRMVDGS